MSRPTITFGHLVLATLLVLFLSLSEQIPPPLSRPLRNVQGACRRITCPDDRQCRVVHRCLDCDPETKCIAVKDLDVDNNCLLNKYEHVLLVQSSMEQNSFSPLVCKGPRAARDCPGGSVCVDDFNGGGICCTGKMIDCGGCERGEKCIMKGPGCAPLEFCFQAEVPSCVPEGCLTCKGGEECIESPHQPPCANQGSCPKRYKCAPKNRCGNRPCPTGEECKYYGTECHGQAEEGSGSAHLVPYGCHDRFRCQQPDKCGGCASGYICEEFWPACESPCDPATYGGPCPPPKPCLPIYECKRNPPKCPGSDGPKPDAMTCMFEVIKGTCSYDSDCIGNMICCKSGCGNIVCQARNINPLG